MRHSPLSTFHYQLKKIALALNCKFCHYTQPFLGGTISQTVSTRFRCN
ncbi:MAG: hypothetical protein LBE12_03715 [Planctomycetaceae bacterium]|nr:hypothetical protein [Planctomycetaceae bacterium]